VSSQGDSEGSIPTRDSLHGLAFFEIVLGAGSVWVNGALFEGGLKAKALRKYYLSAHPCHK